MRLGMKYLRLFERCAVVTDIAWLREATRFFSAMMPCPVNVFPNAERAQAIDWLAAPARGTVPHRLLTESGVLVAWKGEVPADEAQAGAAAAAELGLEVGEVRRVSPYPEAERRTLHVFRKIAPTPERFPRRASLTLLRGGTFLALG